MLGQGFHYCVAKETKKGRFLETKIKRGVSRRRILRSVVFEAIFEILRICGFWDHIHHPILCKLTTGRTAFMESYDRVDFYRKNRDYGSLLDDGVMAEEEVEEAYEDEDDDEGSEQCRSESEDDPEVVREQQQYLERREKLKELERQKLKQKLQRIYGRNYDIDSEIDRKKLPYDNYGSFFGPSQPVVARRVIEEAKARMEAAKIVAKASNDVSDKSYSTASDMRYEEKERPKVRSETKTKAQQLKAARDYSFLFNEDAEIPGTDKMSETKSNNFSRPDNGQSKASNSMSSTLKKPAYSSKQISSTKDTKGMVKPSRQMAAKVGTQKVPQQKVVQTTKPCSSDPRNQINKAGSGSVRLITQGNVFVRPSMSNGTKVGGVDISKKKASLSSTSKFGEDELQLSTNARATVVQKSVSSKPSAIQNVHPDQRKHSVLVKPALKLANKVAAKPAAKPGLKPATNLPSKPQVKPVKTAMPCSSVDRSKKRPKYDDDYDDDLDSGGNYRSLIRQMFRYNPNKYGNVDDDDDRAMEVGFNTIQAEERRSAKIAKEEDERELALIEAEERAERLRAKKRKL